jgi:hypothetical protein
MAGKKRAKIWYEVMCDIHGVKVAGHGKADARLVKIAAPKSRKTRYSGCPACNAIKNREKYSETSNQ